MMTRSTLTRILTVCAGTLLSAQLASGSTVTISTSLNQLQAGVDNQGWISDTQANNNGVNDNYFTGLNGANELRSYFFFDRSAISGTITAATLEVRRYDSSAATLGLFDVSTPAASLIATRGGAANPAIFADLGTGTSYGSFVIAAGGASTDILSFVLNASAIADLNAASGYFAIGGRALTGGPLFSFSAEEPGNSGGQLNSIQRLVLTVNDAPTAVPEPASMVLLGTGIVGIGARRWRNRRQRK
jgi:hypothetical protein